MVVDLADRDLRVLELVSEYPTPATSTLREAIYWADKNQHIHYRLDNLEEKELVETWKDNDAGTRGPLAPRRADTTAEGEELLEAVTDDSQPEGVKERLDELEKQVRAMSRTYGEVKQRIVEIESELKDVDGDVGDVAEDVETLRRLVADEEFVAEGEFGAGD